MMIDTQPARPETLGEALRMMREKAGVDLQTIVDETKVSRRVFEAFENGRYQILPEKVFCRNFLRQYLSVVGGDNEPWLTDFDRAWDHFEMSSGTFKNLVVVDSDQPGFNWRLWMPVFAGAFVIVGLVTVVILSSRSQKVLPPDPRRSSAERATPVRTLSTPTPFAIQPSPLPSDVEDLQTTVTAVVRVRDSGECWIHYRDREGRTGQELLFGGTSRKLELAGPAMLTLGNADAATITVGDHVYSGLGRAGQVAHFELGFAGLTRLEPGSNGG
jgi:cytoskeletal protein RodZ